MSVMWRLAKTCSRIHKPWRRNLKQYENFFRHDHYYSPIPLIAEVTRRKHIIFSRQASAVADVDLRVDEQLALLDQLAEVAPQIPFDEQQTNGARYWLDNPFFPYADGIFYHCLLRHARPRRVIEIGTGYSSAVCLDTCDRFLDPAPECTFVEPYRCKTFHWMNSGLWKQATFFLPTRRTCRRSVAT